MNYQDETMVGYFFSPRQIFHTTSRQFFGKEFPCQTKPKIVIIIIIETNFPTKRTLTVPSRQSFWEVWKRFFFQFPYVFFLSLQDNTSEADGQGQERVTCATPGSGGHSRSSCSDRTLA